MDPVRQKSQGLVTGDHRTESSWTRQASALEIARGLFSFLEVNVKNIVAKRWWEGAAESAEPVLFSMKNILAARACEEPRNDLHLDQT
jgi:hypothetical protein